MLKVSCYYIPRALMMLFQMIYILSIKINHAEIEDNIHHLNLGGIPRSTACVLNAALQKTNWHL